MKVNPFLRESSPKLAIIAENELGKKTSPHQQLEMCSIRKILLEEKPDTQKPFIKTILSNTGCAGLKYPKVLTGYYGTTNKNVIKCSFVDFETP
ncbi:hypothetical protein TNCV_4889871 [Trichonephila clavipes]|nr:hypothetical protein TNCV_4889871 [Trichonephila clavipes]